VVGAAPWETALIEDPAWIQKMIPERRAETRDSKWPKLIHDGVDEGERNSSIARLSGLFLRKYIPPATVLEVMLAFNESRCRPPLEASEVSRIVHSINARELWGLRRK
jgi:hypothetical protein